MADAVVIKEFLATLGYRVDESSQRRFMDAMKSMTEAVVGLGLGLTGAAAAVVGAVASMASSGEQMHYMALTINDTVSNIDALVYAWQKLGLAPQATTSALQNLANMIRTEPGLRDLWNQRAGSGTLTEQFTRMGERFQQMTGEQQREFRQNFEKYLGTDVINAWITRGAGARAGEDEFNMVKRLFRFDPDAFARESVRFEQAWLRLNLRINAIWGEIAQPILERMTRVLETLIKWVDDNRDRINAAIDAVGKHMSDAGKHMSAAFEGGVKLVTDIIRYFQTMADNSAAVAEAIAVVGLAFTKGGWLKLAAIAYLIERLLEDYEKFKTTGQSDLGIPWESLGKALDELKQKFGELNDALGGFITPWHALEAYLAGKFLITVLGVFRSIGVAAITTGGSIAAFTGSLRSVAAFLLANPLTAALVGAYLGVTLGKNSIVSQEEENKQLGGAAHQRFPNLVVPKDRPLGPTDPSKVLPDEQGRGFFGSITHALGELFGFKSADASELPMNVKALKDNIKQLDDTLNDMMDKQAFSQWASGIGLDAFGGASGGGQGVDMKDPKVVEAIKYFMGKGWTLPQAVGIVANLYAESRLDPTVTNATGHAGVAQWDQHRQQQFRLLHGKPVTSATREEQYDFVNWEYNNTERAAGNALRATRDFRAATDVGNYGFERSGVPSAGRIGIGAAMMRSPNVAALGGAQTSNNVEQNNNVTINTTADPNDMMRALDSQNRRQYGDLQRHLSNPVY